ncbi:MAG: 3-isopropylmalate dehydratase small subunit [Emcibacteraceae bacterium]|nr:3-isopropylmalate dehydratase small subunit [Emcibacteraceae bacterium]MDG1997274.1 3-isopropylmalate dehydratase small subunit [Emcibacteraceae bacterium]
MMEGFKAINSKAIPLLLINVDTDAIIPSREMKRVSKRGLSEGLFAGWRYKSNDSRELEPDFILNDPEYNGAQILLGGDNFGCGSSREHAVWALHEYGIRVIIAPSFGAIFYKNCVRNGILPILLSDENIELLSGKELKITLENQMINDDISFEIAPADKEMLLDGLDDIELNLKYIDDIRSFENNDRIKRPWAYL